MKIFSLAALLAGVGMLIALTTRSAIEIEGIPNQEPATLAYKPVPGRVISLIPVLADPSKYHGREIEVEAFFSYSQGHFILAPDLSSLAHDVAANCYYLDLSSCLEKDKLLGCGNPAICCLRGVVDASEFGPTQHSMLAGTFRAKKCTLVARLRPEK